jgi:hypothetical protein
MTRAERLRLWGPVVVVMFAGIAAVLLAGVRIAEAFSDSPGTTPLHLPDGTTITCTVQDGHMRDCALAPQPVAPGMAS